ncbi:MAG: halocarboxylic acid dehydrogenase DehI family protein [Hyphomicrobiales bacterium]
MKIERIKPVPIPAVYPHWEFKAEGELRDTYERYKAAMQIPWVGVVTMAYAHYRPFFDCWWKALEPVVQTNAYVEVAQSLRAKVETDIEALNPPPISERLFAMGYSSRELDEMREMIDIISHGNFMQIPAVMVARLLLEGGELLGGTDIGAAAKAHGPEVSTPFVLLEPHHVLPDHQAIYEDIKTTLGLPFVNTDYRCFARWPSYFDLAWKDLKTEIQGPNYEPLVISQHEAQFAATATLANPTGLTAETLKQACGEDLPAILETVRLFTWLLPGLTTNVAYFRAQLGD